MQSLTSIAPWSFDEQPDVVVNFFDADRLTGKDGARVNLFVSQADAAALTDRNWVRRPGWRTAPSSLEAHLYLPE